MPYEGVILIDEIDAHLHPAWQKRIGFWLKAHFPNIQFIVTTHSPFICQAADIIRGTASAEDQAELEQLLKTLPDTGSAMVERVLRKHEALR